MQSYYKKRNPCFVFAVILLLVILVGFFYWKNSLGRTPEQALAQGFLALEQHEQNRAESLFEEALSEPTVRHWAFLGLGKIAEQRGAFQEAKQYYLKVDEAQAAWPDASLGLVRLAVGEDRVMENPENLGALISRLELMLPQVRRLDLLPMLLYLRGSIALRDGDLLSAASLLRDIRSRYPKTEESSLARDKLQVVRERLLDATTPLPFAQAIEELELLLLEDQAQPALELIHQLKDDFESNTPGYFRMLLLEERALRMLGRPTEADHTLAIISADGDEDSAAQALLKMTKFAWNINEHQRALDFIANYKQRFPRHASIPEVIYIEGRIYEEQKHFPEAKQTYSNLNRDYSSSVYSPRALHRLSWIYLLEGNYALSAEHFAKAAQASRALSVSNGGDKELHAQWDHTRFWLSYSLDKLGEEELRVLMPRIDSIISQEERTQAFADSYYRMLMRKFNTRLTETQSASADLARDLVCAEPMPMSLGKTAEMLVQAGLGEFGKREVDYVLAKLPRVENSSSEAFLDREMIRAFWYASGADISSAITQAQFVLKSIFEAGPPEDSLLFKCREKVEDLVYPLPFRGIYQKAFSETKVPLSFLYGVTHTESHFNPRARSHRNALGLMQLLAKTAEHEGFSGTEAELFSPETSIFFGAKHLARLLERYSNVRAVAAAAYNAGPTAVDRWLTRHPQLETLYWIELISYPETKDYVKKVLAADFHYAERLVETH